MKQGNLIIAQECAETRARTERWKRGTWSSAAFSASRRMHGGENHRPVTRAPAWPEQADVSFSPKPTEAGDM